MVMENQEIAMEKSWEKKSVGIQKAYITVSNNSQGRKTLFDQLQCFQQN